MTRLRRGTDRVIGGVASGLAEYFQVDPLFVRVAFVALAFAGGAGLVLYLVLWVLMPPPGVDKVGGSTMPDSARGMGQEFRRIGDEFRQTGTEFRHAFRQDPGPPGPTAGPTPGQDPVAPESHLAEPPPEPGREPMVAPPSREVSRRRSEWIGGALIVVGLVFLIQTLGLLNWWDWSFVWPLVLIGLGIIILIQRLR
jgi:phage shock protein C